MTFVRETCEVVWSHGGVRVGMESWTRKEKEKKQGSIENHGGMASMARDHGRSVWGLVLMWLYHG